MTDQTATLPETVAVVPPLPLAEAYDYALSGDLTAADLPRGTLVEVPFARRTVTGVVWGSGQGGVPPEKLKSILRQLPISPLSDETLRFVDWVSAYCLAPRGAVLKLVIGNGAIAQPKKHDAAHVAKSAAILPNPDHHQPQLSGGQMAAAQELTDAVRRKKFSVTLLDGVTGSGKTEVFCEAVAECLRQGRQALVLLPEIAMTAALMDRFTARFGVRPTEWHSDLGEKQRRLNWHAVLRGDARFVVGARSALFLPYRDLGVIVVDEEHEASYKQEEGVIYHGRDMAVVRGQIEQVSVILASATPSLETLHNVEQGKYAHVKLTSRYGVAQMPDVTLVDLRQHKMTAQQFISPPLMAALQAVKDKGQQAMLFLNRRGYAPLTLCRACGHRMQCPSCSSWLIEHRAQGKLRCHHCDYAMRIPPACPSCAAEGKFAPCGPGVERIAEEMAARLPELRCAVMASDTVDGPKAAQELVNQMARQELDVLIGTQIMAKGYHFPRLTLVGVVDGDLGLGGGDPRTSERTFQLLQQMAGRSGRAEEAGQVMVQTTQPEHPVMQAIKRNDRDAFMASELAEREAYHLPPFARLAHITISGTDQRKVEQFAAELAQSAPRNDHVQILGPAPAPFALLRGRYRHRLLVQAPRTINVPLLVKNWLATVKIPSSLRIAVDVDPYSFI